MKIIDNIQVNSNPDLNQKFIYIKEYIKFTRVLNLEIFFLLNVD